MLDAEKELFDSFRLLHGEYALAKDTEPLQAKFNQEGEKVLKVVRTWEDKLCHQSEKGGYGVYSGNLAEKFQAEVKKEFPMIDHVGIIVKTFSLKKIKLQ